MSIQLLSTGLAHWNILWQKWIAGTGKLFFISRKTSTYPTENLVIAFQSSNTNWSAAHGGCFVARLLPRALAITKSKHHPRTAFCLQKRDIVFVPKKIIHRPSAGPIPGGDFSQCNWGWLILQSLTDFTSLTPSKFLQLQFFSSFVGLFVPSLAL